MPALHPRSDPLPTPSTRRRCTWIPVTLVSMSLVAFGAGCGGDAGAGNATSADVATSGAPQTAPAAKRADAKDASPAAPKPAAVPKRTPTVKDARKAVDKDDYAAAAGIAKALPRATRSAVRKRVSNRLGRRANAALKAGNRSLVLSLLAQSESYPKTDLVRKVRADYLAAEKAFEARGNQRVIDRKERGRVARAKREAARARARVKAS